MQSVYIRLRKRASTAAATATAWIVKQATSAQVARIEFHARLGALVTKKTQQKNLGQPAIFAKPVVTNPRRDRQNVFTVLQARFVQRHP